MRKHLRPPRGRTWYRPDISGTNNRKPLKDCKKSPSVSDLPQQPGRKEQQIFRKGHPKLQQTKGRSNQTGALSFWRQPQDLAAFFKAFDASKASTKSPQIKRSYPRSFSLATCGLTAVDKKKKTLREVAKLPVVTV